MSVQTINGHVLIANMPDWASVVSNRRTWETSVVKGEIGNESRSGLRAVPLARLEFEVFTDSLAEAAKFDDVILAARKAGKVVVPYWGRGTQVASASGDTVVLAETGWPWQAGDWLFIGGEMLPVASVAGNTLTLDGELESEYSHEFAWPLLFGKMSLNEVEIVTPRNGQARISVTELVSSRSVAIGGSEAVVVDPWIFN